MAAAAPLPNEEGAGEPSGPQDPPAEMEEAILPMLETAQTLMGRIRGGSFWDLFCDIRRSPVGEALPETLRSISDHCELDFDDESALLEVPWLSEEGAPAPSAAPPQAALKAAKVPSGNGCIVVRSKRGGFCDKGFVVRVNGGGNKKTRPKKKRKRPHGGGGGCSRGRQPKAQLQRRLDFAGPGGAASMAAEDPDDISEVPETPEMGGFLSDCSSEVVTGEFFVPPTPPRRNQREEAAESGHHRALVGLRPAAAAAPSRGPARDATAAKEDTWMRNAAVKLADRADFL